ncbi:hypothetical protein [Luteimonas chenhongjianii]|uniref:hypothetical protein n=1 Tax=Luteimonas chenhongjianii TaxID=2006110 RepID=UPI001FEAB900|nr:hypothetical protein [Luteimonas chenhongjianii]
MALLTWPTADSLALIAVPALVMRFSVGARDEDTRLDTRLGMSMPEPVAEMAMSISCYLDAPACGTGFRESTLGIGKLVPDLSRSPPLQ